MVQAIQVLRFHLLELEKVSVLHFILVILHIGIVCSPEGRQVQQGKVVESQRWLVKAFCGKHPHSFSHVPCMCA